MCWLSESTFLGRHGQADMVQGQGTQENCFVTCSQSQGFRIMGFVSRLSLAHHLACSIWHDCGPSCRYTHLSAKVDSIKSGPLWRLADILWACNFLLLVAPPKFYQLVFSSSTMFPSGDLLLWGNLWRMQAVIIVPEQSGWFQSMLP